ncbi:MAG: RDD family protein [Gammaproteobacteria bacterium]|jgi:uncharacterized RDD family membrane protein YckC
MHYAGFWRRAAAVIIDSIVFSFLLGLLLGPAYINADTMSREGLIGNAIAFVLTVGLWVRYLGTPGKLLLGCQIVDADTGEPINTRQAVIRYLGYFVSIMTLFVGFLWMIWDKRNQTFHDKMANTVVVYNGYVDLFDESQKSLQQLISEVR